MPFLQPRLMTALPSAGAATGSPAPAGVAGPGELMVRLAWRWLQLVLRQFVY